MEKYERQASQLIIDTGTGNTTLMNDTHFIMSRFLKDNETS